MFNIPRAPFNVGESRTWLSEIFTKNQDGFILHDALTGKEVENILSNLHLISDNQKHYLPGSEGYTFPLPFSSVHSDDFIEKYFERSRGFSDLFLKLTGQDIGQFLEKIFSGLSGNQAVSLFHTSEGAPFPPATLRSLARYKGGLNIHCENSLLPELSPRFLNHFRNIDIYNIASFLFVLRKAEQGGELELYNVEWDATPVKAAVNDNSDRSNDFFKKRGIPEAGSAKIELAVGDLFVFRAGQIWHKVNDVKGNVERVTMGGFLGQSLSGDVIYYWS